MAVIRRRRLALPQWRQPPRPSARGFAPTSAVAPVVARPPCPARPMATRMPQRLTARSGRCPSRCCWTGFRTATRKVASRTPSWWVRRSSRRYPTICSVLRLVSPRLISSMARTLARARAARPARPPRQAQRLGRGRTTVGGEGHRADSPADRPRHGGAHPRDGLTAGNAPDQRATRGAGRAPRAPLASS